MELDNISVSALRVLLNKDTTLARYYPLIPLKESLIASLTAHGVADKAALTALGDGELAAICGTTAEQTALLRSIFRLHRFTERRLSELTTIPRGFLDALARDGVKTSSAYIALCEHMGSDSVAAAYDAAPGDATRLLCYCDLMRLPGVKETRASLYHACGYVNINAFVGETASEMQSSIRRAVEELGLPQSVPLPKELSTQIAVATVLPKIF